jgi:hypothetical protein
MPRCPGQDMRYWTPKDVFDVPCVGCGNAIEFWKDEPSRICPTCRHEMRNPRIDPGCAEWCQYAPECLGQEGSAPAVPVIDRFQALLDGRLVTDPAARGHARRFLARAQRSLPSNQLDPCVLQATALLVGVLAGSRIPGSVDPGTFPAMLERAGIEATVAQRICDLVRTVSGGGSDRSAEGEVLVDVMRTEHAAGPGAAEGNSASGKVNPGV